MKQTFCITVILGVALGAAVGCVPIPDRFHDTPNAQIDVLSDMQPLANAWVAALPASSFKLRDDACRKAPVTARTDGQGSAHLSAHRTTVFPLLLLGESPEWNRTWQLCVATDSASTGIRWRALYVARDHMWDTVHVVCNLATAAPNASGTPSSPVCADRSTLRAQ